MISLENNSKIHFVKFARPIPFVTSKMLQLFKIRRYNVVFGIIIFQFESDNDFFDAKEKKKKRKETHFVEFLRVFFWFFFFFFEKNRIEEEYLKIRGLRRVNWKAFELATMEYSKFNLF